MLVRKKTLGAGAQVSIFTRFLHPSAIIRNKYPNLETHHQLEGCHVVRREEKKICGRTQVALVVTHAEFRDENGLLVHLHGAESKFHLQQEGLPEFFFPSLEVQGQAPPPAATIVQAPASTADENERKADNTFNHGGSSTPDLVRRIDQRRTVLPEDVEGLRGIVQIDDDNLPAPENIPGPAIEVPGAPAPDNNNNNNIYAPDWGHDGVCLRKTAGGVSTSAKMLSLTPDSNPNLVQLFEQFFPIQYVKQVILVETNKQLPKSNPLTYGEFLLFVGVIFLMSTLKFESRRDLWSTQKVNMFSGAPIRLGEYISRYRFEMIIQALRIAPEGSKPACLDRFWEVRDIISNWNHNLTTCFSPSWITCLDESMSKWISSYTCPGFMFVPRKPWPFGNEYHSICCAKTGIMFQVELVEGKDRPTGLPPKQFNEQGKTVGLLLRLTKPIWGTSKVVILDSGFCVLKGIIALRQQGVFSSALIKKDDIGQQTSRETRSSNI